jgi:hypothetical protein
MNIKEAGRYANYLNNMIFNLSMQLNMDANLYKTVERHLRAKANPEAVDEELEISTDNKLACSVNDLAYLIKSLIDEKNKLALFIENGKNSIQLNWTEGNVHLTIDSAVEYNKNLREFASKLKQISNCKNSETKKQGTDRKFNVEGNQVNYYYDVEIKKTIDFDRDIVVDLYKKTLDKTDEISKQIDEAMLKDVIAFEATYSLYDTMEDVITKYMASKK